jgi:hypothetical protein
MESIIVITSSVEPVENIIFWRAGVILRNRGTATIERVHEEAYPRNTLCRSARSQATPTITPCPRNHTEPTSDLGNTDHANILASHRPLIHDGHAAYPINQNTSPPLDVILSRRPRTHPRGSINYSDTGFASDRPAVLSF